MANSTIAEKIAQAESERQRIAANIAAAYDAAEAKGATMPATENSANLPTAIRSIPEAVQPTLITKQITENGTYSAADDNADGYSEVTVEVPDASKTILDSLICRSITEISSDVNKIGLYAFRACTSLTTVDFPLVTSIGASAFGACTSLTTVDFPLVTSIGANAFYGCTSLTTVDFPLVTSIGASAFGACRNLQLILHKRVVLEGSGFPSLAIIYVENDDLEWYSTATNWSSLYEKGQIKSIDELSPEGGTAEW